jgi:murein tripeptide amidase MpaA
MYRTVAQLDSLTGFLAAWFPQICTRIALPNPSVQGRTVYALRLRAGPGGNRRGVLLVGGTHSRELMNPDAIVELGVAMVVSYLLGSDIVLGGRTWPASDVKLMLDTLDIWLVPCSNPDGREYVLTVDDLWRKNRRDNPGTTCDGVDLNRNCDVLWGVTQGQTSCSPCSDVYAGPSAFSEPETSNIRYLLDTYRICCFADVHSFSELILYPWGHAPTQTTDPSKRFTGLPSGTCMPISQPGYQEYMNPRDQQRFVTVAQRIVAAIAAVRGRAYTPQTSYALYGTTGTHSDYAYSRHIANSALRKTYGFTFETGPPAGNARDSFHPPDPTLIKRDAKSGLLALIQQCICAIELIGFRFLERDTEVQALRDVRDEVLATTDNGRRWISLLERVQAPVLGVLLADERLAREAATLLEVAGRLLRDERMTMPADVAERANALLGEVIGRPEVEEVRGDLEAIASVLAAAADRSAEQLLEELVRRGPGEARMGG